MEVVVTTRATRREKLSSQIVTISSKPIINFLQAGCLPVAQPTAPEHWSEKVSHSTDFSNSSSPGVFQLCQWPIKACGYLGEGCQTSRQPSDAIRPTPYIYLTTVIIVIIVIIIITTNKNTKYSQLSNTHTFVPVAIETGEGVHGTIRRWNWYRRLEDITGDARESNFLFRQLSVPLQRGDAVSFQNTFTAS